MKIYDAPYIRAADAYTISKTGISSSALMEKAARTCSEYILEHHQHLTSFLVICGMGNNGGDGLCIARHLFEAGKQVDILFLGDQATGSSDFHFHLTNLPPDIQRIHFTDSYDISMYTCIIDALIGTGLNRPVTDQAAELIGMVNQQAAKIISIDVPSGMASATPSTGACIQAAITLSFEWPKPAFFFPENAAFLGDWVILPIGLLPDFPGYDKAYAETIDGDLCRQILKKRPKFGHKGNFGHAMLLAGGKSMPGAGHLCSYGAIRAGAGLVTLADDFLEDTRDEIMHFPRQQLIAALESKKYKVFAAGPGLGTAGTVHNLLKKSLEVFRSPVVLDADALNLLASDHSLTMLLPKGSVLTPHPGEFMRLAGDSDNSYEMLEKQKHLSARWQCTIVLKRAHTCITTPNGQVFFNMSGNPGMATAGSGDVLTGIITAFIAQGYTPEEAAKLGVFLHGKAGDLAMEAESGINIIAGDILTFYNKAVSEILA